MNHKISNASFFAALMVVGIHTAGREPTTLKTGTLLWWLEAIGHYGVFLIAVPFFFICSGYFLAGHMQEHGWWRRECVKRAQSLLIPYIVWSLIYASIPLIVFFLANLIHGRIRFLGEYASIRFWLHLLGLNPFAWPYLVPLWYVRALLMFVAISPLLMLFVKKTRWVSIIVLWLLSLTVGIYGWYSQDRLYLLLTKCFNLSGLFYFHCGIYGRMNKVSLPKRGYTFALAYGLFCAAANGYCRMSGIHCVFPFWVPALLFGLWQFIPNCPLPKWLAGSSFAIYILHSIVYLGIAHEFTVKGVLQWIVKWTTGVGVSLLIAWILRKCFPKFANLALGRR